MVQAKSTVRRRWIPLAIVGASTVMAVLILIWGICLVRNGTLRQPEQTEPVTTAQPAGQKDELSPEEPELPKTAQDVVEEYAAQHGLTLADYPEKLIALLERNPETETFVLDYPMEYGKEHEIDISGFADFEGVPLFIQWDEQWGYKDYVGNIAGLSGCGPTCLSMVTYYFTRDPQMHPAYMMDFAQSNTSYANTAGATQWALFSQGAGELGLTVQELTGEQIRSEEKIAEVLASGKVIVANVGPGVFTEIGHYLVVCGYEDGKFRINDPNSRINSEKLWQFEEFSDQIKMMWAFSK